MAMQFWSPSDIFVSLFPFSLWWRSKINPSIAQATQIISKIVANKTAIGMRSEIKNILFKKIWNFEEYHQNTILDMSYRNSAVWAVNE